MAGQVADVDRKPGIRPSVATYGRLARNSTSTTASRTASSIPVSTVVSRTPTIAAKASTKSVRRQRQ